MRAIAGALLLQVAVAITSCSSPVSPPPDVGNPADVGVEREMGNPGMYGDIPCTHDCECGGAALCDPNGYCNEFLTRGTFGAECGFPDANCACTGGATCGGRCCYLPDGNIAELGDPVCAFPDAGAAD
jgi:hypothetical protein